MTKAYDQSSTKAIIREAALHEMAEKGWLGLRTRDVAERAGVNKALVHYHFGSIDNLRHETAAALMADVVNESATELINAPTLAEGLRRFGDSLGKFEPHDAAGTVLMEIMVHTPREERLEEMVLHALDFHETALKKRIEADLESGLIDPSIDSTGLARGLTALLDGLVLHAYMRPGIDFASAIDALATLVEPSLTTRKTQRKRN